MFFKRTVSDTPAASQNKVIATGVKLEQLENWIKYMKQLFSDFGQQVVWNCDP